jgi:transposase
VAAPWTATTSTCGGAGTAAWKVPGKRRAAWLGVAEADALDATERRFVEALLAASADLARVVDLARRFRAMVRDRQEPALDPWLSAAKGTALAGFADGLARDLAAVRAALSLPWSTGPADGQIRHLKTIKRTMPGRAGFDLLRPLGLPRLGGLMEDLRGYAAKAPVWACSCS